MWGLISLFALTLAPFTRYNRLSNRFHNRLYGVYKHSTGCQSRLTTGLTNGCIVYTAGCQTCCITQLNEQWLFVQPVGCLFTRYSGLSNRLYNRFDNRLYRVNGISLGNSSSRRRWPHFHEFARVHIMTYTAVTLYVVVRRHLHIIAQWRLETTRRVSAMQAA